MTVALVTGCSSGIGRATALQLAGRGVTTVATARRVDTVADLADQGCIVLPLDVTDADSRTSCIAAIADGHGGVDILVNNAGYSQVGPVEQVPLEDWRRQLETNLLGPIALTQLVLPRMRANGHGRIVNVSSIAGEVTFPVAGPYHASKYALEAVSDALRMEVASFGIQVALVQPGPVASSFASNSSDLAPYLDGPYAGLARGMQAAGHAQPSFAATPDHVAATVVRAATVRRPAHRYRVGVTNSLVVHASRLVPGRIWDAAMVRQFRDTAPPS